MKKIVLAVLGLSTISYISVSATQHSRKSLHSTLIEHFNTAAKPKKASPVSNNPRCVEADSLHSVISDWAEPANNVSLKTLFLGLFGS